jgi:hypothetical protein
MQKQLRIAGKLQVELARLQYRSTRLVRRWSHLERQRGGIGARGGPGRRRNDRCDDYVDCPHYKELSCASCSALAQHPNVVNCSARGRFNSSSEPNP